MAADTSSQRALAGLGYLLMMSAADGTVGATPFVAAVAPEPSEPEAVESTDVDRPEDVTFVDLNDQAGAVHLDNPPAGGFQDNHGRVYLAPDLNSREPTPTPNSAPSDARQSAVAEEVAEMQAEPDVTPEPVGSDFGGGFSSDYTESVHADEFEPAPVETSDTPSTMAGHEVPPAARDHGQAQEIEYSEGGYTVGKANKSLLASLDWMD